jgi:hypothetical protein
MRHTGGRKCGFGCLVLGTLDVWTSGRSGITTDDLDEIRANLPALRAKVVAEIEAISKRIALPPSGKKKRG